MHKDSINRRSENWKNPIALAIMTFLMLSLSLGIAHGANESGIMNKGPTNGSISILLKVDYWNNTNSSWENEFITLDDISERFLQGNESYIALDQFFNGKYNSSENFTHGDGTYRVYAAVTDPNDNVLVNFNGSLIETSYNFTVYTTNMPPPKVTLVAPGNNTFGYEFRPTFNWSAANDPDEDNVTYTLKLTRTGCYGMSECANAEVYVENITDTSYTLEEDLDLDSPYNWTVKAHDGIIYGEESDTWNYTVMSLIDIDLVIANIGVSGLEPGDNESTADDSPQPFIIENKGNVFVNLTLNATSDLWDLATLNTRYFMFMAGENPSKPGSFNMTLSANNWLNVSGTHQLAVANLDYNNTKDYAEIEIAIEVPQDEPPGAKSTNILIEAIGTKT